MTEQKIVIVGAGLVGSLLAVMLRKKGKSVLLIEKRSDMRADSASAGRSINLVVTSRGVNALKQVGLWERVKEITVPVFGRMIHDREGESVFQPYGRDNSECNFSVSRGEINKLLMTEAETLGVQIKFSSPIKAVDFNNRQLTYESGGSEKYDVLFGADGGGSVVREKLMSFLDGEASTERFSGDYKEMFMPAKDSGDYPIEKNALHIWPRGAEMLMALPNGDGSFTMTLYMPAHRFEEMSNQEKLKAYFNSEYHDSIPLMPNYSEEFFENPQGFLGTVRCSPWIYKDSVCMLGDAAHAIVPFFGQGMNAGFEDCYYLMKFLEEEEEWGLAFQKYNQFQKPNADAIADMAVENAFEMSEKVGDKDFRLQKQIEHKIESAFPEKYRSRYGMVTYTLIPYALVYELGLIQQKILSQLSKEVDFIDNLDLARAEALVDGEFLSFVKENNISFSRYII